MEISGRWSKDENGLMEFESYQVQRIYQMITDQYYSMLDQFLDDQDEEFAALKARERGYSMITDYKSINGTEEFATTYLTPTYTMDLWYEIDPETQKKDYMKGFVKVSPKR